VVGCIAAFTAGIATWWSSFGWIAWGPRLTIPFIPAFLLAGVWAARDPMTEGLRWIIRRPLALAAVYSSTKAALHSYTLSQRYKLKNTFVSVLEIVPPWVQTDLGGSSNEPRAMPLAEFIEETIKVLGTDAQEVLVERAKPLRNNPGPDEGAFVTEFNELMVQAPARRSSSETPLELTTTNNLVERQK